MDKYRSLVKKSIKKLQEWIKKIIDKDVSIQADYVNTVNREKQTKVYLWRFYRFCTWIGKPIPLFSMLFAIAGVGYYILGPKALILEAGAYLLSQALNFEIKAACKRNRPPENLFESPFPDDIYSFPSGHAAGTISVAVCMSAFIPILWPVIYPWSLLMGLSRFFGGYHYPTDVIVGFLVGIISGRLAVIFFTHLNLF